MQSDCCFENPSYFYFLESEHHGSNGTFYFTYFTQNDIPVTVFFLSNPQYDNGTTAMDYLEGAVFITNCLLSCLLNSLVVFTIATGKELWSPCNVFILNLTIADLIFGLTGPLLAFVRIRGDWSLGDPMCHFTFYLQTICGWVICWSIATVSIDRYIHIVHPLNARLTITLRKATVIALIIWLMPTIMVSPLCVYFNVIERPVPYSNQTAHVCTLFWPEDIWFTYTASSATLGTFLIFILPGLLISWSHFKSVNQIHNSRESITRRFDSAESTSSILNMKRRRALRDYRVVRTFRILFVLFFMTWCPLFCTLPIIVMDWYNKTTVMTSRAMIWTLILTHFSTVINPVVYGLSLRTVRGSLLKHLRNHTQGRH